MTMTMTVTVIMAITPVLTFRLLSSWKTLLVDILFNAGVVSIAPSCSGERGAEGSSHQKDNHNSLHLRSVLHANHTRGKRLCVR